MSKSIPKHSKGAKVPYRYKGVLDSIIRQLYKDREFARKDIGNVQAYDSAILAVKELYKYLD